MNFIESLCGALGIGNPFQVSNLAFDPDNNVWHLGSFSITATDDYDAQAQAVAQLKAQGLAIITPWITHGNPAEIGYYVVAVRTAQ